MASFRSDSDGFASLREYAPDVGLFNVNASQSSIAMRGATSLDESAAADPAVALYIDDFYVGRGPAARVRNLDVDRVAIQKGPQGTRFGRNALGGAVNFISAPLRGDSASSARIYGGDHLRLGASVKLDRPISDEDSIAALAYASTGGASVRNRLTGSKLNDEDMLGAQIRFQHRPTADHYLWASATVQHEESDREPRFLWFNQRPPSFGASVGLDREAVFQREDVSSDIDLQRLIVKAGVDSARDDGWQLIAGYQNADIRIFNNDFAPGGGDATILALETVDQEESQSLEARFWTGSGRLGAIFGVYARHADGFRSEDFIVDPAPGSQASFIFGDARKRDLVAQSVDSVELAGFASATLRLARTVKAELGGRYTWERKRGFTEVSGDPGTYLLRGAAFRARWSEDWASFTPRADLHWTPTDRISARLSWARGFKAGGFTNSVNNPVSAVTPFAPETAEMFEAAVGFGSAERLGRIELAAFRIDFRDLQTLLVRNDPVAGIVQEVVNAGSARSHGIDLDYRIEKPAWRAALSATYLVAKYRDFTTFDAARGLLDFSGDTVPLSPRFAVRIMAEAGEGIGPLHLVPGIRFLYRSKVGFFPDASPSALVRDQTDTHDLAVWLRTRLPIGTLTFSATNLLDERVFTFANNASSSFVFPPAALAQGSRLVYGTRTSGRQFTITLEVDF